MSKYLYKNKILYYIKILYIKILYMYKNNIYIYIYIIYIKHDIYNKHDKTDQK